MKGLAAAAALPLIVVAGLVLVLVLMGGGKDAAFAGVGCNISQEFDASPVPGGWGANVASASKASGIPGSILAAQLESESGWNPKATSPVGARGIAQFMPGTWDTYGAGADPFDPAAGIAAQGRYMGALRLDMEGISKSSGKSSIELALAAYNAGPGAVKQFGGIPPYAETQNYVVKITKLAASKYGKDGIDSSAKPDCAVSAGAGDDLPWKTAPSWLEAGAGPASTSPLGMYNRECVDFALWRVNQQLGSAEAPFKALNSTFRPDGHNLGNAVEWLQAWQVKGWPTGQSPRPGAVVYYGAGRGGADPTYGHVAVVQSVNADGTYVEEGYNGEPAPNDHQYYTRVVQNTTPSSFLYMPGIDTAAPAS